MVAVNYSGVEVHWTDREWDRLTRVKNGEFLPKAKPVKHNFGGIITTRLPDGLEKKVREYAERKSMSIQELLREVMFVLTESHNEPII